MGSTVGSVIYRGVRLNTRTIEMFEEVERITARRFAISQGSYSGSVEQSAGTHSGGGAMDISGNHSDAVVAAFRRVGFAAWLRTPSQGDWGYHIHAIALDDSSASPAAKRQMVSYRNGRNGLKNNGPDDGPRLDPIRNWEQYLANKEAEDVALSENDIDRIVKGIMEYQNSEFRGTDFYGIIVSALAQGLYVEEQAKSIAAGSAAIARAMEDGRITKEEYAVITKALSGRSPGRVVPDIPHLPRV